jgi:hypothetical protein
VAKKTKQRSVEDLLQDLVIVQLATAGVSQAGIRKIVGVDMQRVSRIAKFIKKQKSAGRTAT